MTSFLIRAAGAVRHNEDRAGAELRPTLTLVQANAGSQRYMNHVITNPAVAANVASVVAHPTQLTTREFTISPTTRRSLLMRIISTSRNGVEKPCTIPANT